MEFKNKLNGNTKEKYTCFDQKLKQILSIRLRSNRHKAKFNVKIS